MKPVHILIAEDDVWYSEFLEYQIRLIDDRCNISKVHTGKELIAALSQKPDVITLDYSLPDFTGADLLKRIKQETPSTQVVIISGQNDVGVAVGLLKDGAYDYIVKDVDTKERIWKTIVNLRERNELTKEVELLREAVTVKYNFDKTVIGQSPAIKSIFGLLEKAANSSINVSITGETGTGKEMIAKAVHYNSSHKNGPFVAVNLGAIPRELVESELFGHEKGSFTGAFQQRIGKFEEAEGGTIFLDEIGEMDLSMQVKLLRVLQEREITRVGGNRVIKVNCRIISATHKDLEREVEKEHFRQDLFYRLIGLPVELPPLRKRGNDVILLANHFIDLLAKEQQIPVKKLDESAIDKLMNYTFPGNVRELRSIMELAFVLSEDDVIQAKDLKFQTSGNIERLSESNMTLHQITMQLIHSKLAKYDNDTARVARELDIGKSTIYRLLKEEKEAMQKQRENMG
jgi:two-component system, NtrC family, response regulator AtoC